MLVLNAKEARHIILHLQGLTRPINRRLLDQELLDLIDSLGFVQVDSIQWVERAHHMILFARNQTYRPKQLDKLVANKGLFENWTHDSSYIPARFYPYWRHKFERDRDRLQKKFHRWQGGNCLDQCEGLIERIRDDGPLMSRDLERPKGKQEMWQWHDGKAALEFMWRTGGVAVKERVNFQKVYDLPERCLESDHIEKQITKDEFIDWACRSALEKLGFGTPSDIAKFWDLLTIDEVKSWLSRQDGQVTRTIEVIGHDKTRKTLIARADIEDVLENLPKTPDRIRALSPFDPVIRDRKRLLWLWGFDYRIEIYVPAEKRQWGYYVFPLLERDRIVGRIDMRADRKANALKINQLWVEKGIKLSDARMQRLESELIRQARFADVQNVVWENGSIQG